MKSPPFAHPTRKLRLLAAAVVFACAAMPAMAQPAPAAPAEAPKIAGVQELSLHAWKWARDGRLSDLWKQLNSLAHSPAADRQLLRLGRTVDQHLAHQSRDEARRRQAFTARLGKLKKELAEGKIRDALFTAVEAHGLSAEPAAFLDSDPVKEVERRVGEEAAAHETAGRWVKALTLYRGLDLLFEAQRKYTDRLKQIGQRVALLRLYAPARLFQMYRQAALDRGEDEPKPWNIEADGWQKQLEGINLTLLSQSIHRGASEHIEDPNYKKLLLGGINHLEVLLTTRGLGATFPAIQDPARTGPLVDHLRRWRLALQHRIHPMNYTDMLRSLEQLIEQNGQTVKLPESVVIHQFGNGAMSELDEFSAIVWPHQMNRFKRTTSGKFSGVGIQISLVNDELTVVTPLENSPAHRAGVRPGERIVSVDGKSTLGFDLEQAVERITGEEGTAVALGLRGAGSEKVREVKLVRASIRIDSIKGWQRNRAGGWDYRIDPELQIGYIRLTTFGPNTATDLDRAVEQMVGQGGLRGLVLDLRFNPGGRLDAAIDVSNRFLEEGTIVSTTQKTFLGRPWRAAADRHHTYASFPVVVLVNKGSASASEIVSGALQAHERALVIGERSFGKGSVQNLFPIGGNAAYLKLTTQYYRLPDNRIIHRRPGAADWGISPDVAVAVTDAQVAAAIEARMILDVLPGAGEKGFDPTLVLNKQDPEEQDADRQELKRKAQAVRKANDLLTQGLDPQLNTALLLLQARVIGQRQG